MIKTEKFDFDQMLSIMRSCETGCLIESFVRVEYGESFLKTAWDAFRDLGEYFDEEYDNVRAMANQFVLMLDDEVRFKDVGLPICL